jgi:hypothetical protein
MDPFLATFGAQFAGQFGSGLGGSLGKGLTGGGGGPITSGVNQQGAAWSLDGSGWSVSVPTAAAPQSSAWSAPSLTSSPWLMVALAAAAVGALWLIRR